MNAINWKKLLLPNIPYLFFVYLFDKVGQAVRLSPGADLSGKVLSLGEGFSMAFANPLPSFAPMDLLIGIVGAVLIRLMVYFKGKNAKKYRKGIEYGSARWGTAEDIKPYTDPVFQNNVLLTQTERLTMNSRPKQPKYAKEILIGAINGNLSTMFGDVNEKVGTIAAEVGKTPQGWNANIFNMIQNLSENVIVPIAGLVITYDPNAASFCSRILFIQDGVIFHELRRKIPNETQEDFYARILQVMAQMGGGSANVL